MNTDFRISVAFARHHKIRKLVRRLGYEGFFSLACLWAYAAAHKPKGDLTNMTVEDIEMAAEWLGEPATLVNTLIELRLIDVDEVGCIRIHNWRSHNGYAFYSDARVAKAQKAASARWNKRDLQQPDIVGDATDNAQNAIGQCSMRKDALPGAISSNAPSPSPSPPPAPAPYSETDSCAERSQAITPAPTEPELCGIDIPLVDGTSYSVTKADVALWQDAYPNVDVPAELKRIRSWADANPKKRKTPKGIRRCINQWLAREQDKGGHDRRTSPPPPGFRSSGKTIGGLTF